MWGPGGAHAHHTGAPGSSDDEDRLQVVYGEERGDHLSLQSQVPGARAARSRYVLAQASSAVKPGPREAVAATPEARSGAAGAAPPPRHTAASPAASPAQVASPGSPAGARGTDQQQPPPQTLAQELQTVLHNLTQQGQARQQWALPPHLEAGQEEEEAARPRRRSGVVRRIAHTSPAVPPPQAALPGGAAAPEQRASGRRWRRPAPLAQPPPAPLPQPVSAGAADGGSRAAGAAGFFDVDPDLLQAHVRRRAVQLSSRQQRRGPQQCAAQRESPLAAAQQEQPGAEHTPAPSQRPNPLAALLGGSGGGARQPAATTGGKARGRHPIYGAAAAAAGAAAADGAASSSQGGGLLWELGPGAAPLASPRQHSAPCRQPQHQHSRFAIRDAGAGAGTAGAAASQTEPPPGGAAAGPALRLLVGGEPASALRQQHFQPRPPRPSSPGEGIEEEGEELGQAGGPPDRRPHEQPPGGADAFRTPGQPLRHAWQGPWAEQVSDGAAASLDAGCAAAAGAEESAPLAAAAAPGSSGGKPLSLQRQFIAQLQPVSRPAAAATMQQQRQRLAGAAGLHARLQAVVAAERAGLAGGRSPAGGVPAGPRLTVLHKELEAGLTKCHCRCDVPAAGALGAPEVLALLQNRAAREVDTAPGSVLLLREPWRVIPVQGSPWPAVLCYAVAQG